jgi:protein-disulfide isomerase/uncharacterized membrane protein
MNKRLLLVLSTLAGVINGIWMLMLHVRYDKLGGVCAVNETISCEILTFKEYSEWFQIPTPVFALFTFLVLFILALRGLQKMSTNHAKEDTYTFVLSTIALFAGVYMAYISFIVLKKICVFCFIYYIIIIATWILAWKLAGSHGQKACGSVKTYVRDFYKNPGVWLTGVAFACVLAFSYFAFQGSTTLSETSVTIKGDEMKTSGNPNAKVTISIFSDFQCPACKNGAKILKDLESTEYGSKIKIVYKFFPLDPSCNEGAPYGSHLMACDAAKAAVCAAQQQKFWRYHDQLFENQQSLYEKKFFQIAEEENLNIDQFGACYHSKSAMEEVKKDAAEGTALPVSATPSVYLNGKKFEGALSVEALQKMIDQLSK